MLTQQWFRIWLWLILVLSQADGFGLTIQFDYRYDTSGFFSGMNSSRRAILAAAAQVFETRITSHTYAITPFSPNAWWLTFPHPATGELLTIKDPIVPADTVMIYVGARDMPAEELAASGFYYHAEGATIWIKLFEYRNSLDRFDSFGGSIAFNSRSPWYFDANPATLESFPGKLDLYSVALHEIGHLLGYIEGCQAYTSRIRGDRFTGTNAAVLYGNSVPLNGTNDLGHWKEGLTFHGQETAMDPTIRLNSRKNFTELDFAVLKDIGYTLAPPPLSTIRITRYTRKGNQITLSWQGGYGPYQVQKRTFIPPGDWQNAWNTTASQSLTLPINEAFGFLRITDLSQ